MKQAVKTISISVILAGFILNALIPGSPCFAAADKTIFTQIAEEKGTFSCLSATETELFNLINQYRRRNGLPAIPNSRSLNKVARMHAADLNINRPDKGRDSRGLPCSLHSWSKNGFWSPVCYTADHYYASFMYNKPREITKRFYNDLAYENVYWASAEFISPQRVVQAWEDSEKHRDLILEKNMWAKSYWKALGVGVYKNVVTIWVGSMPDPSVPMKECANGTSLPVKAKTIGRAK
jgi:uncharacterized protein YkwD